MSEDNYRRNPNFDSTKPRIAGILREHGLLSGPGYVNQIYDEIRANGGNNFLKEDAILRVAKYGCKDCRDNKKLCIHIVPEDQELWTGVFDEGFEDYNSPGTRSILLSETKLPIGPSGLANTLRDIYSSQPDRLALTQQAYARRQELAERNSMISQLIVNGSFVVVRPSGEKIRYDVEGRPIEFSGNGTTPRNGAGRASDPGFQGMDFAAIKQFYETVMEQRRLRSLSKEELRAEINPIRKQIFEAASASSRPNPAGFELINPDSGEVIATKRDLIRYVNAGRYNTERLLKTGPNGSTDKAKAREFERILNS